MVIRRATTLLFALVLFAPAASAANFPGWQRTYDATSVTLLSPQEGDPPLVRRRLTA